MEKIIVSVIIVVVLIGSVLYISEKRDRVIEQSANIYNSCMLETYQQTPEQCRDANHGVYCLCK